MMQQKSLEIIRRTCKKVAKRFTFDIYEAEDIEQEAFLIAMEIIDKWDEERDLENWLTVCLSNRLRNFVKKHSAYSTSDYIKKRAEAIFQAADLLNVPDSELPYYEMDVDKLDIDEILSKIDHNLSPKHRRYFLIYLADEYLNKEKREELFEAIREIIDEEG